MERARALAERYAHLPDDVVATVETRFEFGSARAVHDLGWFIERLPIGERERHGGNPRQAIQRPD